MQTQPRTPINPLYQPTNPQEILNRCNIKPWGDVKREEKDRVPIRNNKTSFEVFMFCGGKATQYEHSRYKKMILLKNEPFSALDAITALSVTNAISATNRLHPLRKDGLLAKVRNSKPAMFIKTQLGLDFEKKMQAILKGKKGST